MAMAPAFTEEDLEHAADGRSFERGFGYLDAVRDLEVDADEITATVYGNAAYDVTLTLTGDGVEGECTCPYGLDGHFCKHCVAVGLTVLRDGRDLQERRASTAAGEHSLREWLASLPRQELLDLLLAQVKEDRELRRRLELRAATASHDTAAILTQVRGLLDTRPHSRDGYVEYDQAFRYARQVQDAAAAIETLIDTGHAAAAMNAARDAIETLEKAYEYIDDSSAAVSEAADDLSAAHVRACVAARPDPAELADYLAGRLLRDGVVVFEIADYAEALGEHGLAGVRERVAAVWQRNPTGWREKHVMESLTRDTGDVNALIRVIASDLDPRGYAHLRIAKELDAADRGDEALDWAERGLRDARQHDSSLVDYVTERHRLGGRPADAVRVRRDHFTRNRTLQTYQQLRNTAEQAGVWQAERGAALATLRADAVKAGRQPWAAPVWIDALLDDGDIDGAWQAAQVAEPGGGQWLRLADAIAPTRPGDALPVYVKLIEPLRNQTGDSVYEQVVKLLIAMRGCWQRLGRAGEFTAYAEALRAEQKRKRNLMRLLDEHGL